MQWVSQEGWLRGWKGGGSEGWGACEIAVSKLGKANPLLCLGRGCRVTVKPVVRYCLQCDSGKLTFSSLSLSALMRLRGLS